MITHNFSGEAMEETLRREEEQIRRRFRLVLQDIEELRPNKIILQCIHPLPKCFWMWNRWNYGPDEFETNFYEGAYRFSEEGHLYFPMKMHWRMYVDKAYRLDDFGLRQLKKLFNREFHYR